MTEDLKVAIRKCDEQKDSARIKKLKETIQNLQNDNERLREEIERLQEYEWMYKDLCK